jgi:rhodanese-related sulfurtransferase
MDDQPRHYKAKLEYEIDPWDLNEALGRGDATTAHLDKGALIVTCCVGIRCNGSTKGALNMLQLGFRVKELIGGLDCWRCDGYPVDGLETAEPAGSCGCS